MKQIIFTAILILVFCFVAFAQTDKNSCPKIKIKSPETVDENDETFNVSASFENQDDSSISKFNWIVVKDDEVIAKNGERIIDVSPKNVRRTFLITILAQPIGEQCQNPAMAKVIVLANAGSPLILDNYEVLDWNDEKQRLSAIAIDMKERKDSELLVYLDFDRRSSQTERKNYLTKVLNQLTIVRGLEKNRITFLISESATKRTRFQPVSEEILDTYARCDDCLIIKAEDFEKLENLFRPKTTAKNRKK